MSQDLVLTPAHKTWNNTTRKNLPLRIYLLGVFETAGHATFPENLIDIIADYVELRFVVFTEFNQKEQERFLSFLEFDQNQEELLDLDKQLNFCSEEIIGDGSVFCLHLDRLVPEHAVDAIVEYDDFNSYMHHQKFTGKMSKISVPGLDMESLPQSSWALGNQRYLLLQKNSELMECVLRCGGIEKFFPLVPLFP